MSAQQVECKRVHPFSNTSSFFDRVNHGETLKGTTEISRNALLRLKALVVSREGMIARAYIAEKIDTILSGRSIPLDPDNEEVYRRMADKEACEITDVPGPL